MEEIIIGQEAICPDGLGRVSEIEFGICDKVNIRIDTYIKNRGCMWASHNVELIDPRNAKPYTKIKKFNPDYIKLKTIRISNNEEVAHLMFEFNNDINFSHSFSIYDSLEETKTNLKNLLHLLEGE